MIQFLVSYGPLLGYILVFLGAMVEGETLIIVAGYFAFKGVLSLPRVILVAFLGTILTDQTLFFVGKRHGPALLDRHPKLKQKSYRVFSLLHRYENLYIFGFRFIYGIRIVSPLIIGTSGISAKHFILLDLLAALIWCSIMAGVGYGIGYFFHDPIEIMVQRILHYEKITVLIIIVGISLGIAYYYHRKRKHEK